jgi:hypothetical protein
MSQGEFKKRLKAVDTNIGSTETMILYEMIDEARKEWPLQDSVFGIATQDIAKDEEIDGKIRPVTLEDIKAWFLKWFGEASSK